MKFQSDILARANLVVNGTVTFNSTATGQTPAANDNSTNLVTTAWVRTYVAGATSNYVLPTASASTLGGIKVGTGLSIDETGILSVTAQGGVTSFNTRTGAITLTSSDVTTALTYTPVTNARTITINGTGYDLSADRTWSVGTVTGTGTANYLTKFTGSSTIGNSGITDDGSAVGIGITPQAGTLLYFQRNFTGSSLTTGIIFSGLVQSDSTIGAITFYSKPSTANATFSLATLTHFRADQGALGTGSSVGVQYGFLASAMTWGNSNYGFYGNLAAGTGRWNFYAGGTANNYMNGNLLLGTTTDSGYKIDVNGTTRLQSTTTINGATTINNSLTVLNNSATFTSGGNIGTYSSIAYSIPAGSSFTSGAGFAGLYGYVVQTWAGSSSVNSGSNMGGIVSAINNAFSTTGATATITQPGSGIRALAALQAFQLTSGSNAGTITHGASLFVQGIYPNSAAVVTFTNYYGLLINNLTEWGTVNLTNRWAIYQAGSLDNNYFAGTTTFNANVTAASFIKAGGTSSQFLKADGSVDSNTYLTSGSITGYVPTSRTITINGTTYDLTTDRSWTVTPNVNAYTETAFTATAAQTTFSVSYTVGFVSVYYNGSKLAPSEYTATTGTSVVLGFGCAAGDIIDIIAYSTGGGIALTSLSATTPLSYNNATGAFSIQQASGSQAGYLSSTDWTTFNNKLSLSGGTLTGALTGTSATFSGTTTSNTSVVVKKDGSNVASDALALVNAAGDKYFNWQLDAAGNLAGYRYNTGVGFYKWLGVDYTTGAATFSSSILANGGSITSSSSSGAGAFGNGMSILTQPGTYTSGHGGILQFQNEDVITAGIRGIRDGGSWGGALVFYTHNTSAGNTFDTTFLERMRLTTAGNLGIGINPSYPLDMLTASSGTFNTIVQFQNTDYTSGNRSFLRVRQWVNAGGSSSSYFGTGQDGNLYVIANNSARGGDLIINAGTGAATFSSSITATQGNFSQGAGAVFNASSTGAWTSGFLNHSNFLAPSITGGGLSIGFGKAGSTYNLGKLVYNHVGDASASNYVGIGFWDKDNILNVLASGNVGINTASPSAKLHVNGSIGMGTNSSGYPLSARFVKQGGSSITFTATLGTIGAWRPGIATIRVSGGQNGLQEYWAAWFVVRIISYFGSGASLSVISSGGDTGSVTFTNSSTGSSTSPQTVTFTVTDNGNTTDTMIADIDMIYTEGIISIS